MPMNMPVEHVHDNNKTFPLFELATASARGCERHSMTWLASIAGLHTAVLGSFADVHRATTLLVKRVS